jgi:hypothetical protein
MTLTDARHRQLDQALPHLARLGSVIDGTSACVRRLVRLDLVARKFYNNQPIDEKLRGFIIPSSSMWDIPMNANRP